ncbi:MAG: tRNA pseudouridine(55) synthase TruB [Deinococcales bacterium]
MPVYIINKTLGLSSHDVVAKARRHLSTKAVGHAGTLDPLATGVLVVLSHDATKLSPFLTESKKSYLAWVSFGASTATLDAEGPILAEADASHLTLADIELQLDYFLKLNSQMPPSYSAIKQGGVKAYEAARKGEDLRLKPRPARYYEVRCLGVAAHRQKLTEKLALSAQIQFPETSPTLLAQPVLPPSLKEELATALFEVKVQAGTYIRAFARDLGERLGLPAHLSGLIRTRAGRASLLEACALEDIAQYPKSKRGLLSYPEVLLSEKETLFIRQGKQLALGLKERSSLISPQGHLVAIAEAKAEQAIKLLRVWQEDCD